MYGICLVLSNSPLNFVGNNSSAVLDSKILAQKSMSTSLASMLAG